MVDSNGTMELAALFYLGTAIVPVVLVVLLIPT